jgi:TRAP-type C4-dicarboxylate transport system permease small subunit
VNDVLETGGFFNRSHNWLRWTAILTAVVFALFCISTAYFVAQYFVCIGECAPGTPSVALLATSIFFGLIPAVLTAGMGYFIVRGLWEDARARADELRADEAGQAHPAADRGASA